jgi:hypothetical protein
LSEMKELTHCWKLPLTVSKSLVKTVRELSDLTSSKVASVALVTLGVLNNEDGAGDGPRFCSELETKPEVGSRVAVILWMGSGVILV